MMEYKGYVAKVEYDDMRSKGRRYATERVSSIDRRLFDGM